MADPAPTDPTPTDPAATPPPPGDPAPTDPPKAPPWGDDANFNAEEAWKTIQNLRREKGDPTKQAELEQKVADLTTAQQAQADAIAKALGLKSEDDPPDPTKLAEQIAAEQGKVSDAETRATTAERKLAVFLTAADPEIQGNALALLDSTSFLESIKDVDPTDAAKVTEAVTAAIEKNPLFKASATPGTPPFPGGPRSSAPTRAGSMGEAIARKLAAT